MVLDDRAGEAMEVIVTPDACPITRPSQRLPAFLTSLRTRFTSTQGTLPAADVFTIGGVARDQRTVGQRRIHMHPDIHADGTIQAEALDLNVAHQLDEDPGGALDHPDELHLVTIITSSVLPPAEPPNALDLDRPVLAVEGGLLVECLKRHHATVR